MSTNEYVGFPTWKIILRKRVFQEAIPPVREFDVLLSDYLSGKNSMNIRRTSIGIIEEVGAVWVAPLMANRNNYMATSANPQLDPRYKQNNRDLLKDINIRETTNEIRKRIWVAKKTVAQKISGESYVEPWEVVPKGYTGPIWREEWHEPSRVNPSKGTFQKVSWVHQLQSDPNVEWFLHQDYGNFTNESFWIDVVKYKTDKPKNKNEDLARYYVYGENNPVHAYFAIRIGANSYDPSDQTTGTNIYVNRNYGSLVGGPYDIVFPIDGTPFIYDHTGDETDDPSNNGPTKPPRPMQFSGYIASQPNDPSWSLRNDISSFRIMFTIARGKLIIKSTFANTAWTFPVDNSSKANSITKRRYANFHVPASRVSLFGRGFSFRFNFNPLEFDIYNAKGTRKESDGSAVIMPLPTRQQSENSDDTGWGDISDKYGEDANFVKVPFDKATMTQDSRRDSDTPVYAYGFDLIAETEQYPNHSGPPSSYTSMMIRVNREASIQKLVHAYLVGIESDEDIDSSYDANYGFETTIKGGIFEARNLILKMWCKAPEGPASGIQPTYCEEIGDRFASPIVWRLKGRYSPPEPPEPEELNITKFVKRISYDTSAPDITTVRQNMTLSVLVPKDYNMSQHSSTLSRSQLLHWLEDGVREVEVSMGWMGGNPSRGHDPALYEYFPKLEDFKEDVPEGKRIMIFTGITDSMSKNQSYAEDVIDLKCTDRLKLLESYPILNSPIYDGMLLSKAFINVCQLGGLSQKYFDVDSEYAETFVLPMGFTFQEPALKFEANTTIFEAIRRLSDHQMHVIETRPDGTIVLADAYPDQQENTGTAAFLEDLDLTHPSYEFYVDGDAAPNAFQRIYDAFNSERDSGDQRTQIQILTTDRTDGSFLMSGKAIDLDAMENPNASNFIGYSKPFRLTQPAFGEQPYLENFEKKARHLFQPPLRVQFHLYGRPTLRPNQIIGIHHSDEVRLSFAENNFIKYRIVSVSGSVDIEDSRFTYRCDITAEHM